MSGDGSRAPARAASEAAVGGDGPRTSPGKRGGVNKGRSFTAGSSSGAERDSAGAAGRHSTSAGATPARRNSSTADASAGGASEKPSFLHHARQLSAFQLLTNFGGGHRKESVSGGLGPGGPALAPAGVTPPGGAGDGGAGDAPGGGGGFLRSSFMSAINPFSSGGSEGGFSGSGFSGSGSDGMVPRIDKPLPLNPALGGPQMSPASIASAHASPAGHIGLTGVAAGRLGPGPVAAAPSSAGPSSAPAPGATMDEINGDISDGPLFRATLADLEKKTTTLKHNLKTLLKSAEAYVAVSRQHALAEQDFMEALTAQHAVPTISQHFAQMRDLLTGAHENYSNVCQNLLIDPLRRIYEADVKLAESRKRDFEDASRDYYSSLARYLGIKADEAQKKKLEQDLKFQAKKREFDLQCFDYSNFLKELHTGQKDQEISFILGNFAEKQFKMYKRVHEELEHGQVQAIGQYIRDLTKSSHQHKKEKEERRRVLEGRIAKGPLRDGGSLERAASPPAPYAAIPLARGDTVGSVGGDVSGSAQRTPLPDDGAPSGSDCDQGLSVGGWAAPGEADGAPFWRPGDLAGASWAAGAGDDERDAADVSPSGPAAAAQGAALAPPTAPPLAQQLAPPPITQVAPSTPSPLPENYPADAAQPQTQRRKEGVLLLGQLASGAASSIKSNVTPTGWKKIWVVVDGGKLQEYSNWKKAPISLESIDLAFCTVREARNCDRRFCFEVISPHIGKRIYQATDGSDFFHWTHTLRNAIEESLAASAHLRGGSGGTDSAAGSDPSSLADSRPTHHQLVQRLRAADSGNYSCADCNTRTPPPEWVCINLGAILCIECSGIHRSLGTHISKVRSLTLDVTSFTPELVALLLALGNTSINMILEAQLSAGPDASGASRSSSSSADRRHRQSSSVAGPPDRGDSGGAAALALEGKPSPSDSREVKAAFIQRKYQLRHFVDPAPLLDADLPAGYLAAAVEAQSPISVLHALLLCDARSFAAAPLPLLHVALGYRRDLASVRCRGSVALAGAALGRTRAASVHQRHLSAPEATGAVHDVEGLSSPLAVSAGVPPPAMRAIVAELLLQNGIDAAAADRTVYEAAGDPARSLWMLAPAARPRLASSPRKSPDDAKPAIADVRRFEALWRPDAAPAEAFLLEWSALHYAVFLCDVDAVAQLATRSLLVSSADSTGRRPLQLVDLSIAYWFGSVDALAAFPGLRDAYGAISRLVSLG